MLDACREPRTVSELLGYANARYLTGWQSETQISTRRGWLQSFEMIAPTGAHKVRITAVGQLLLDHLEIQRPFDFVGSK